MSNGMAKEQQRIEENGKGNVRQGNAWCGKARQWISLDRSRGAEEWKGYDTSSNGVVQKRNAMEKQRRAQPRYAKAESRTEPTGDGKVQHRN